MGNALRGFEAPSSATALMCTVCACGLVAGQLGPGAMVAEAVTTPRELVDALAADTPYILITSHLALSGTWSSLCTDPKLAIPANVTSIVGNCSSAAPSVGSLGPPLLSLRSGQCVLTTDVSVFEVSAGVQNLWISNLYFRGVSEIVVQSWAPGPLIWAGSGFFGTLWLERLTFQGQGGYWQGVHIKKPRARLVAKGCAFRDLRGFGAGVWAGSATLSDCLFANNDATDDIQRGYNSNQGIVDVTPAGAGLLLQRTRFVANLGSDANTWPRVAGLENNVYSDNTTLVLYDMTSREHVPPEPLAAAPVKLRPSPSAWLKKIKKAFQDHHGPLEIEVMAIPKSWSAVPSPTVATGADLAAAVAEGVPHILVTDHINLNEPDACTGGCVVAKLVLRPTTKSIVGNCTQPPPASSLLAATDVRRGQCVLQTDMAAFATSYYGPEQRLWLANLYLHAVAPPRYINSTGRLMQMDHAVGAVYIQHITFNGFDDALWTGFYMNSTEMLVYAEGCVFRDLNGWAGAVYAAGPSSLQSCSIIRVDATVYNNQTEIPSNSTVVVLGSHVGLRLENTSFVNITGNSVAVYPGAAGTIYSDDAELQLLHFANSAGAVHPLESAPAGAFLMASDPWLVATREEFESEFGGLEFVLPGWSTDPDPDGNAPAPGPQGGSPREETSHGGGGDANDDVAGIAAGAIGGFAILLAVSFCALYYQLRRRRLRLRSMESSSYHSEEARQGRVTDVIRISYVGHKNCDSQENIGLGPLKPVPPTNTTVGSITTLDLGTAALATRSDFATLDNALALERSLDLAHRAGHEILGTYLPLGGAERCSGGQGCVQFVRHPNTQKDYAVKFFLQREAFNREAELYRDEGLSTMMPATIDICKNENCKYIGPDGYQYPPFIIIDRGESLAEWLRRWQGSSDIVTALQALIHIANRLKQMHEAGWVHMDLKPSNVLWLPQKHEWTLIDFGCTAAAGKEAPLAFTPAYAAPEIVAAYEEQKRTIFVEPSADIWSFGLVAYEMLSGSHVFKLGTPRAAIFDALMGRTKLPWEAGKTEVGSTRLSKLRAFRSSVMQCLNREAAKRPTIEMLLNAWYRVFETHATTAVAASGSPKTSL